MFIPVIRQIRHSKQDFLYVTTFIGDFCHLVEKHHQEDKDFGQLNILPNEQKNFTLDIDEIKRKNVASLRGEDLAPSLKEWTVS